MSTTTNPLAAAAKKSKAPHVAKKPGSKRAATATRVRRTDVPYEKIAKLFNDGKGMKEISDSLELTESKKKTPYSIVNNALYRLGKFGVKVGDKTIKIKRG